MSMAYTVREYSSSQQAYHQAGLSSFVYPIPGAKTKPIDEPDGVTFYKNKLCLYELRDLPHLQRTTFLSYIFGEKHTHFVVLSQSNHEAGSIVEWILFEAKDESGGREGLERINKTLLPLLQNGTVLLSEDLLDSIITPEPTAPENLTNVLLELMENHLCYHQEWPSVVQALLNTTGNAPKSLLLNLPAAKYHSPEILDVHAAARENKSESIRKALVQKVSKRSYEATLEEEVEIDLSLRQDEDVFDFDVVDAQSQDTPLYTSVQKGYVKSSFFFLLGGANPNFVHPVSGNTCLHLAAGQGSVKMIKLLLTFYADPSIRNADGRLPADVLADIPEFEEILSLFEEIEKLNQEYKSLPNDPVEKASRDGEFLLSFDGGGSRCLTEIQTLIAVEKRMLELNPNCKPFISHFDYVAGTSGGAFHALTLIYNKVSLKNDRTLTVNGTTYFEGASAYEKTKNVERLIKNTLGETRVMSDVTSPRIIVTGTLANTIPPKLHLITNYGEPRDGQPGPDERKIWEAARISSAAPTYLMSYENFVDGGLMANNPTVDAIVEMNKQSRKNYGHPLKLACVLSMGSGQDDPTDVENIDVSGPPSSFGITGLANRVDGYKNLITLIISQVTQVGGQDVARAEALCDLSGGIYYRLVAPVGKAIPLDTYNLIDLIQPMFDSFMYTLRNPKLIDSVARTLLSNPRLY